MTLLRRRFISLVGSSIAALTSHPVWGALAGRPPIPTLSARLEAALPNAASARALGNAYLAGHPEEADAAALARRVTALLAPYARQTATDRELSDTLARLRASDFRRGDIVDLDGWMLSRSEVTVCALVAAVRAGV
jgi:hypothetical protein